VTPRQRRIDPPTRDGPVTGLRDEALALLEGWHAPTADQERLREGYVAHLRERPDGTDRGCLPQHLTAGAVILSADGRQVLLTLHTKARQWFHTGGHCEPGDTSMARAALREGTEESGIDGLELDPDPVHLDRHDVPFCGGHGQVAHLDVRFLAVAPAGAQPQVSEESIDVRWWPVDELPPTPDLPALVAAARERFARSRGSRVPTA